MKILLLTILSFNVMALSCPVDRTLHDMVLDMVTLDLSGIRMDGLQKGGCLKQEDHPYILAEHDASNEQSSAPSIFVDDINDVKILDVELVDEDTFAYETTVEFKGTDSKGVKTTVKGTYMFFLNKSARVQKNSGCLSVLAHPERIIVFKKCMDDAA